MTIKRETLKDIIKNGIPNIEKIDRMKTFEREVLGQPVICINADVTISETVGKDVITGKENIELYFLVNTHELLNYDWQLIA